MDHPCHTRPHTVLTEVLIVSVGVVVARDTLLGAPWCGERGPAWPVGPGLVVVARLDGVRQATLEDRYKGGLLSNTRHGVRQATLGDRYKGGLLSNTRHGNGITNGN
jgi:hypothetical protein